MFLLGLAGALVTLYAIKVEKSKTPALCDGGEHMSCSRVLRSPYAKSVGLIFKLEKSHPLNLPNTYYGMLFYVFIMLYDFVSFPYKEVVLLCATSMSCLACIGLAYILYFKLKDFCVVCVTTYVINLVILYNAIKNY